MTAQHLINGNLSIKTGADGAGTLWLTEVNLLDIELLRLWVRDTLDDLANTNIALRVDFPYFLKLGRLLNRLSGLLATLGLFLTSWLSLLGSLLSLLLLLLRFFTAFGWLLNRSSL